MLDALGNLLQILVFFSPPFLLAWIWRNFFKRAEDTRPAWVTALHWASLVLVTALPLFAFAKLTMTPMNVEQYGWGGVAEWRSFTGSILRASIAFLLIALLGRKGTRILGLALILATDFDCLMIDMMA